MRRCSETPRQDAVGERFAAGLDRATKIGEGNMSFKRSVLITAIIAVTTACTTTGDQKNEAAPLHVSVALPVLLPAPVQTPTVVETPAPRVSAPAPAN